MSEMFEALENRSAQVAAEEKAAVENAAAEQAAQDEWYRTWRATEAARLARIRRKADLDMACRGLGAALQILFLDTAIKRGWMSGGFASCVLLVVIVAVTARVGAWWQFRGKKKFYGEE